MEATAVIALIVIALLAGATALTVRVHDLLARADYREALVVMHRPLDLDPLVGRDDPAVRDLGQLLYRSLAGLGSDTYPVPDLAKSITVSPDGLAYHVMLNAAKWSDGRAIGTADVVATVTAVQARGFADRALAGQWQGVIVSATADAMDFKLPAPRAGFNTALAQLPIMPLAGSNAQHLANLGADAITPLPTSGAYRVTRADANAIELEGNPQAVSLSAVHSIEFLLEPTFEAAATALSSGAVDGVMATDPAERSRLAAMGGVSVHDITTFRFVDLLFNERVAGLDDPAVRHALGLAVDESALRSSIGTGTSAAQNGPIPAGIAWATSASVMKANPAAAVAALRATGWTLGADSRWTKSDESLVFRLFTPDSSPLRDVAHLIAQQLAGIDVVVNVVPVAASTYLQNIIDNHGFDMAIADWDNGPDPDVSSYWRSNAGPPAGFSVSGAATDPFLDQALDALATLSDRADRIAAANRVTTQLDSAVPAVFLYAPTVSFAVRDATITVAVPTTGGSAARFADIATWRRR